MPEFRFNHKLCDNFRHKNVELKFRNPSAKTHPKTMTKRKPKKASTGNGIKRRLTFLSCDCFRFVMIVIRFIFKPSLGHERLWIGKIFRFLTTDLILCYNHCVFGYSITADQTFPTCQTSNTDGKWPKTECFFDYCLQPWSFAEVFRCGDDGKSQPKQSQQKYYHKKEKEKNFR